MNIFHSQSFPQAFRTPSTLNPPIRPLPSKPQTPIKERNNKPSPGIYAVTTRPLLSLTLAVFRSAEFGFFGFVVYYAEDGSLSEDGLEFLRAAEELLAAFGGRPHWGKYFDEERYDWRALYPRWDDFLAVRDALDPRSR